MNSFHDYQESLESLSTDKQSAFGCACCELTLPFFEQFCFSSAPRSLLDAQWSKALSLQVVPPDEMERRLQLATNAIPHIDQDSDLTIEIAMKAAVPVLEVHDLMSGNAAALTRIAAAPLEVLALVQLLIQAPIHPDFELFDIVHDETIVPKEIYQQWVALNELSEQLKKLSSITDEWRASQVERGHRLVNTYLPRIRNISS